MGLLLSGLVYHTVSAATARTCLNSNTLYVLELTIHKIFIAFLKLLYYNKLSL